ncbi:MAG: sulfurtransferase [Syntrophaceae bacterium]
MKAVKTIIVAVVVIIIGFLVVYSQTGIPEEARKPHATAGGYGGGGDSAKMPKLAFIALPGDEGVIPAGANPQLLVTTADLEKNLGRWIVVDCREADLYAEGHIPSAIHLGETCNDFFRGDLEVKGQGMFRNLGMRPVEVLEKKLGGAGIGNEKTVVFYDGKMGDPAEGREFGILAGYAFVPFWFMEYLGHKDVRVLDGGIVAWTAEERAVEEKGNKLPPTTFKANVMKERLVTTEEMIKIAKGEEKGIQVVDTRTPLEYSGKSPAPPEHFLTDKIKRAGRVPHVDLAAPHFFQFVDMETLKLRPVWQLQRIYAGLDKNERTVAYCILGNRSSMAYFVMRVLGFKSPANYHDSWFVYGNDDAAPVETGSRS